MRKRSFQFDRGRIWRVSRASYFSRYQLHLADSFLIVSAPKELVCFRNTSGQQRWLQIQSCEGRPELIRALQISGRGSRVKTNQNLIPLIKEEHIGDLQGGLHNALQCLVLLSLNSDCKLIIKKKRFYLLLLIIFQLIIIINNNHNSSSSSYLSSNFS